MYPANLSILWENIFSKYVIEVNENTQIVIPAQTCSGPVCPSVSLPAADPGERLLRTGQ